jgi:hypothetical protein
VPGRALDATPTRVVWIDAARMIQVRTLATGADAPVKVDTVKNADPATWSVSAHLFSGGVLVWNRSRELFDWRAAGLSYLGQAQSAVAVDGDWASYYLTDPGLIRRDLAAGSNAVMPGPIEHVTSERATTDPNHLETSFTSIVAPDVVIG